MKIKIEKLKLAKYNPRRISDDEYRSLQKSLKQFGFIQNVIINKDKTVISGHQRIRAWQELGHTTVPVIEVDLNKKEEKALNLAMNRIGGEFDEDKLFEMIDELRTTEELELTGFSEKEISKILDQYIEENIDDDDDSEKEIKDILDQNKKESFVKEGDIYQLGNHRLMCGDSTSMDDIQLLTEGAIMDMVWTDPPYNINYESMQENLSKIKNDKMSEENFQIFIDNVFNNLQKIVKPGGVFYICSGWQSFCPFQLSLLNNGLHISETIIWVKQIAGIRTLDFPHKHEQIIKAKKGKKKKGTAIFYGWKKGANHNYYGDRDDYDIWEVDRGYANYFIHPTEKPDWLVMKAIKNSTKYNDKVIDLFGGSGSALIACEKLGRTAYVMEIDPRFVEATIYRYEKLTKKKAKKLKLKLWEK